MDYALLVDDHTLLVDDHIEDGKYLIEELVRDGFDLSVAFWVKTSEGGLWYLYIGSQSVGKMPLADAYRAIYSALHRHPSSSISLSEIKLIRDDDPIAAKAIEVRDRHGARFPIQYRGENLGTLAIEEVYIYPRKGPMTAPEVLQAVLHAIMTRAGVMTPAQVTLRDGTRFRGIPAGIQQLDKPDAIEVVFHDHASATDRTVRVHDVVEVDYSFK